MVGFTFRVREFWRMLGVVVRVGKFSSIFWWLWNTTIVYFGRLNGLFRVGRCTWLLNRGVTMRRYWFFGAIGRAFLRIEGVFELGPI
jgi:hypothetical protein